jgi:hypothetical protein
VRRLVQGWAEESAGSAFAWELGCVACPADCGPGVCAVFRCVGGGESGFWSLLYAFHGYVVSGEGCVHGYGERPGAGHSVLC